MSAKTSLFTKGNDFFQKSQFRRYWVLFVFSLTSLASILGISAIIWALPRGFDWTDEAWVYSLIASNRITVGEPWGYQHVLHPIFAVFGNSVLIFRVLRLLGYFSIGILASWSFITLAKSRGWMLTPGQKGILLSASQFGTLIAFSYPPRYLSYNELAAFLTQLFVVVCIFLYSALSEGTRLRPKKVKLDVLWAAIGVMLVILFAIKITSFAVVAVLTLVFWLGYWSNFKLMSRRAIAVVIGIGVAFAYLILTGFPFSKYFGNLQYVFFSPSAQDDYDHPVGELLQLYVKSIIDSVISFWPILVSLILLLAFSILISRYRRTLLPLLWPLSALMVIISLFAALSWSREFNWPLLGTVLVFLSLLLSGMFLAVIDWDPSSFSGSRFLDQTKSSKNSRFQIFILLGVIIGAPLAAAVGTNNPIAGQMIFSATIWVTISVGFLLVLSNRLLLWQNVPLAFGLQGIYAVLAMVVLLAFAHDLLKAPYRTQIYSTQNSNTDAHYLAGLKLLSSQSNWANWISKSADDLNAQDVPTVAINSPGVLLAFNNSGLASPWVSSFWPVSAKSVSLGCSSLAEKPKDFFVLQDGHVGVQDNWDYTVSLEILKCGFEFPRDFEIVAQHTSAVVQDGKTTIWRVKTP